MPLAVFDLPETLPDRLERRVRIAAPERGLGDGDAERGVELRLDREPVQQDPELLESRAGPFIAPRDEQRHPARQAVALLRPGRFADSRCSPRPAASASSHSPEVEGVRDAVLPDEASVGPRDADLVRDDDAFANDVRRARGCHRNRASLRRGSRTRARCRPRRRPRARSRAPPRAPRPRPCTDLPTPDRGRAC